MNIGFYRASLIGDNMVALYGIYAMKCLHPDATLIVYTNAYGINLYSQFHFICPYRCGRDERKNAYRGH
ncbi:hypothetical protein [uncultured Helicobacter sp.]|uniref:hypothetical protein n=1 Tax=uncultured Helicobacter sp. TaxID=175537 RepID=UPI0026267C1E|nr:hypothetical protein [uncultured Helicobacter sp.]